MSNYFDTEYYEINMLNEMLYFSSFHEDQDN